MNLYQVIIILSNFYLIKTWIYIYKKNYIETYKIDISNVKRLMIPEYLIIIWFLKNNHLVCLRFAVLVSYYIDLSYIQYYIILLVQRFPLAMNTKTRNHQTQ